MIAVAHAPLDIVTTSSVAVVPALTIGVTGELKKSSRGIVVLVGDTDPRMWMCDMRH